MTLSYQVAFICISLLAPRHTPRLTKMYACVDSSSSPRSTFECNLVSYYGRVTGYPYISPITAAIRPVCPLSRRWEKNKSGLQEVHSDATSILSLFNPQLISSKKIAFLRSRNIFLSAPICQTELSNFCLRNAFRTSSLTS